MMKDAESHAGDDEKKKAEIEARNRLDGLTYSVEKTFNENKDKLDAASSTELETAISEAKTALGGTDADAMNTAFERVQTASHKLAEVLYSQTAQGGGESTGDEQASSAGAGAAKHRLQPLRMTITSSTPSMSMLTTIRNNG
jgi:molecular chaperone DnaK